MALVVSSVVTATAAPSVALADASACDLWVPSHGRIEVDSATDLNALGSDDECDGFTAYQTADIDLDDWVGPSQGWFGTFDGTRYRFFDSNPDPEAPLFDDPHGPIVIVNVKRFGDVIGTSDNVGGLVGYAFHAVTISDSYMKGDVTGTSNNVGGLVGFAEDAVSIVDSYSTGTVTGGTLGVGIAIGGLVGFALSTVTVTDAYSTSLVSGVGGVGGLIGVSGGSSAASITNSYSTGVVSGWLFVGGLIGIVSGATITSSYSTGSVLGNGMVGGLVGWSTQELTIAGSFSSGDVGGDTAILPVGGLVGQIANAYPTSITDSYVAGTVSGYVSVGGMVGDLNFLGPLSITNSYTKGAVLYDFVPAGGLVATPYGLEVEIDDSFCVLGVAGCLDDPNDVATSPSNMRSVSFLRDDHGWNFRTVWCVSSSKNGGFPVLRGISFGPGAADCRDERGPTPKWTVTFDPAGGVCGEHSSAWTVTVRGSRSLPTATDCRRDGHVLLGWTRDTARTSRQELLTTVVARSGTLTAVWGALPSAPTSVEAFANPWCNRCGSVVLVWPTSSVATETAAVSVDSVVVTCVESGATDELHWCVLAGLANGAGHSVSVVWNNEFGSGPATSTTFVMN